MSSSKDDSLNKEEFEELWEAAKEGDELDRLVFVCAGHLGMRASEIANLKKAWIDFQRLIVQIPEKDKDFNVKNNASARSIPYQDLRDRVQKEIRRYFDYNEKVGKSRYTIFRRVKLMGDRARLTKKVYPHALRATCAFQLAEAGVNAQGLRQFMGWSKLDTAQKYINQAGLAAKRQIADNKAKLW
uniref:Integrase-recombinase protein n=1 Tax=uncultured organism TaxID=155900 RepID=M1PPT1_9ZZZZ|nr:integrase-recombinase protein [uncultured organism]